MGSITPDSISEPSASLGHTALSDHQTSPVWAYPDEAYSPYVVRVRLHRRFIFSLG